MKSAVALLLALSVSTTVSGAERIASPDVPTEIQVIGAKPFFRAHAVGTQNYMCVASGSTYEWKFIGPQATAFDSTLQQVLTHFHSVNAFDNNAIQATWQHSRDSSAVWARLHSFSTDPAYVAPGAIEWLLLDVTGREWGPTGGNKLTAATQIQRINTVGGVKPSPESCSASTVNTRQLVPYEADYYFY